MNRRLALQLALCSPAVFALTGKSILEVHAAAPLTTRAAINKAGRQRMLSQRLAKAWIMLGMNIAPERARTIMTDSLTQFEAQLVELRGHVPSQGVRDAQTRLEKEWVNYKSVLAIQPGFGKATTLYEANEALLVAAHRLTLAHELSTASPADRLVNIAGRQRMLSQRMAKFWLFELWGVNIRAAWMEFGFAREEFTSGMAQLVISPHNSVEVRAAVEELNREWNAYHAVMATRADTPGKMRMAPDVVDKSERVLATCEKVVALYEQQTVVRQALAGKFT